MTFGLCLFTILLSFPGLLLCAQEQRVIVLGKKWAIRAEAVALLAGRKAAYVTLDAQATGAQKLIERKVQREADVAAVLQMVEQEIEARRNHIAATAEAQLTDISLSKAERHHAWERVQAHGRIKTGGMGLTVLMMLTAGLPVWAAPAPVDDLLQRAPTLLILLDNSGGSPALEPSILAHVERRAAEKLDRLPLGASVIVFSVGDPKQIPEVKRWRVQARMTTHGMPVQALKKSLRTHLQGFPARQHPDAHKESHLIQGWFDAAQLLNPKADTENAVIFVTDAMEFSSLANCYKACKLPPPTFTLSNTSLEVLGIGFGQSSGKTLAIFEEWKKFFAAAGVPNTQLLHIF